jgi:hypothetical protein
MNPPDWVIISTCIAFGYFLYQLIALFLPGRDK